MKPDFLEILDKHNPHSVFMDKKNICEAMKECYQIGKSQGSKEFIEWLNSMDYLSDNIHYIVEEWENQKTK